MPDELKKIRGLASEEMRLLISRYLRMNREELQAALGNTSTPAIDLMIASGIVHGIKTGDYSRVAFLLDRTIGKVKDETDMNLKVGEMDKIQEAVGLDTVVAYLRDRKRA